MTILPAPKSSDDWHELLHKLVGGSHDRLVETLGSPSEVILVCLREAEDPTTSRLLFESVLERMAAMWQPLNSEPFVSANFLELLAAFTPLSGLSKILAHFELVGGWVLSAAAQSGAQALLHSHMRDHVEEKALGALERYFPIPPMVESPAYSAYKSLLFRLSVGRHWPHCLRRLLELSLIAPNNDIFVSRLRADPDTVLREIVPVIIASRRGSRDGLLKGLFREVILHRLRPHFDAILDIFDCRLFDDEQYPILRTPFEELTILLDSDSREFKLYAASRRPSPDYTRRVLSELEEQQS